MVQVYFVYAILIENANNIILNIMANLALIIIYITEHLTKPETQCSNKLLQAQKKNSN